MKWEDLKWEKEEQKESLFDRQMRVSWEFNRNYHIETMSEEELNIIEEAIKKIKALKK